MIGKRVDGEGNGWARVFLCGEGPGRQEASIGRPFVGLSGADLNRYLLTLCGLSRADVWCTNIIKWRTDELNSDPSPEDIARDEPDLLKEIKLVNPEIIVPVGTIAARYFLGEDLNMEFSHALPHMSDKWPGIVIFPVYHPSSAMHQADKFSKLVYNSFKRLGMYLRGELLPVEDEFPVPEYRDYDLPVMHGWEVALDTEGTPKKPWGYSWTQCSGKGWVVKKGECHSSQLGLSSNNNKYILHNALWDLPVFRSLGVNLPYNCIEDTMIMAHILCVEPKKLKALCYREAGMKQENFSDVIKDAQQELAKSYIDLALSYKCSGCAGEGTVQVPYKRQADKFRTVKCEVCKGDKTSWGQAPSQLIFNDDFTAKIYQPQSIGRRLSKLSERSIALADAWKLIDYEVRAPVEAKLGKLPEATLDDVKPRERAINYSARDADATLRVYYKLKPRLAEMGLEQAYEIDKGCIPIIDRMHYNGILINKEHFYALDKQFAAEQLEILQKMHGEIGLYFNPASPVQMKRELGKLGLKDLDSTNERTLKLIKTQTQDEKIHRLIDYGLDYRELNKFRGTYAQTLPRQADENSRIHTTFILSAFEGGGNETTEAPATGRFSSRNPNLQNIPVATDRGNLLRAGFIAKPGCKLLSVDLSQIELRVGAHLGKEANMIEAFCAGKDIHTFTAAKMFNVPYELVDPMKHRYPAKCFHPDTEVLTKTGWKRINTLQQNEEVIQATPGENYSVELEWVVPLEVFDKANTENLVHLQNLGVDIRVTPDHRMLGWGSTGKPMVVMPHEFSKTRGWANAGRLHDTDGTGKEVEKLLRLAVATQADGTITESGRVRFGFSKQRKIDRLKALLGGDIYSEGISKNGIHKLTTWFTVSKELSVEILKLLDGKKLPWAWLGLSEVDREIVLDEIQFWDSYTNGSFIHYSSTIPQNVDVLQALATLSNRKTRLKHVIHGEKNYQCYVLTIRKNNHSRGENVKVDLEPSSIVSCLSVPSSFVLVRDGKAKVPLICGQSINFGIFYGMSEYRLQSELAILGLIISLEEARAFIAAWFAAYPGFRSYMFGVHAEARRNNYVRTLFGHIRYVPNVHSKDLKIREEALRQAGNHPIQGTSGEILKMAMANIHKKVYPEVNKMGYFEPLLTIHDEVIFEVDENIAELAAAMVSYEMEHAVELLVPLTSSFKIADNWSKLK